MRFLLLTSSALAALVVASSAAAQPDEDGDVIIVTAQKRAQNVQDVPLAITVFDQEGLDRFGIQQFDDLADFVPGLEVQEQSANNPGFVIRGITSDSGDSTIEPRVAIFQDGVPISRSRGSFVELFDSQVEVVRGPQPTLFGRSALIGAINVTSIRPSTDEFEANIRAGAGNEEFIFLDGAVNVPLSDSFAVRLAGRYKSRDGYIENLIDDEDLNGFEMLALRGSVLFEPTDRVEATLILNYQEDDNPGTSFKSGTFLPDDGTGVVDSSASLNPTEAAALNTFGPLNNGQDLGLEREVFSATGLIEIDLTDNLTLSSVTNYREFDSAEVFDPDGFSAELFAFAENAESEQFFQEFRLGFNNLGRWTGFVGASIFDEEGQQAVPLYYNEVVSQAFFGGFLAAGATNQGVIAAPLAALPTVNADPNSPLFGTPLGVFGEEVINYGDSTSYDLFADATFAATDRFEITAGIRYTYDDKSSGISAELLTGPSGITGAGFLLGGAVFNGGEPVFVSEEYDGLTYRAAAKYDLTDTLTVFANYGHGRRPEVLTYDLDTADVGIDLENFVEVDAEETDAFDVGIRGSLFDGALSGEVVAYYYDYTNFQTSIVNEQGLFETVNAGNASGPGFETSFSLQASPALRYFATYAYNGVTFDDEDDNGNPQDRAGNQFRLSPQQAFTVAAELTLDCKCGSFSLVPVYSYKTETFFDDDNDTTDGVQDEVQPGYGLLDFRATYTPAFDETLDIEFFVENALDEEYILDAGNTGDSFGIPTFIAGPPRMYGVYVSKSF